tara:strand:+ start:1869 stop:3302 length:1434 start_codon:yes stop_codon:yes gene_type:complete
MSKFNNPTLFSALFGVAPAVLESAGLIDPFVDVDTQLFIDPVLLEKSSNEIIRTIAVEKFRLHFGNFVRLLAISESEGDAAWRAAQRLLDLSEPPENGLGYGGSGRSGSSRPAEVRDSIMRTSKEIVSLGVKDPEMVSLMGFFEEKVGPDTISDFTTRAIIDQLAEITEHFCRANDVPIFPNSITAAHELPKFSTASDKDIHFVLVPRDIVRDLPIARDWADIERAAFENRRIRDRVNTLLSGIATPKIADRKRALRRVALESPEAFSEFLTAVKENTSTYDPNLDALGYYKLKSILSDGFGFQGVDKPFDLTSGPEEVRRLAIETIHQFKHHVENGNLWEELWIDDKPKKERAAQLIYYAIAECFCKSVNVDISPEANMGGGPIDFKFSKGFRARVLVEFKRSSGAIRHGYERQLEIYKNASRTQYGIFVVMDYGDLGSKLAHIQSIRAWRLAAGEPASEIIVIDARRKASASKRA